MQCVTDLVKLRDSVKSRVTSLRQIVAPIGAALGPAERRALAFATIELDNLIVVGLRQYTKSSLLRSRTAAGVRITATVQPASTEEAAGLICMSLFPKRYSGKNFSLTNPPIIPEKEEIAFRDPKDAEKVLIQYNASNLPNFVLALSLNSTVFSEAKVCRHFFAHRAKNTYEAVQHLAANMGIIGKTTPEQLIVKGRPGTGVRILDGWLADVETFFDLAT
jgi:hypothetical protein